MKCFGKLYTCDGVPVYIAEIKSGPEVYFDGSLWCEECMGESYRDGNPYLRKIPKKKEA